MQTLRTLTDKHSLLSEAKFLLKSFLLIARRQVQNIFSGPEKFRDKQQLISQPIISTSESNLWNADDNEQNWILTAGKIQNLRLAARRLNGIEVEANRTFSFWKHLGNPNIGQGYVLGREIREGCIVPTIAGGLCQLSNALYDAALKANFEILERHRHTKIIKGSLAEQNRDATVKWNYIDLRFKSCNSFRIEVDITADKLIVRFRSKRKNDPTANSNSKVFPESSTLNDCYSCGNLKCYKHPEQTLIKQERAFTTFILDEKWNEYNDYIKSNSLDKDFFIVPLLKNRFFKTTRYDWTIRNLKNAKAIWFASIKRALQLRSTSKLSGNLFSTMLRLDEKVAKAAARLVPIESTHLVVSQSLLLFLWEQGVFGGRTFDVLMSRLPMEKLHQRLDIAHKQFSESKTLNDYRASQALINLENIALTKARFIITPHQEIADTFGNKSIKLNWAMPPAGRQLATGDKILFPASALGRKGAYELRRLALELNLTIVTTGKVLEDKNFWKGVRIEFAASNPFDNVCLVVYPAYVEHQPRLLLKALAAGIPVITTTACGLSPTHNLTIVPVGDYDILKQAVKDWTEKRYEQLIVPSESSHIFGQK